MARSALQPQTDFAPGRVGTLGLTRERDPQESIPADVRVNVGNETRGGAGGTNLVKQATSPTNASTLAGNPKPKKYTDTVTAAPRR
jgi:hypothetical protein